MANNDNLGNFANRPQEYLQTISSMGGQSNHTGGFANMDSEVQDEMRKIASLQSTQREIASKGGKASGGSFEPGSEKAKEAGKKGGSK